MAEEKKLIAVFGATGHQGKGVVQALKTASQFRVRALSRTPQNYTGEADETLYADLEKPETLNDALKGVYGVFLVTDYWQQGTDEKKQATSAIEAAKSAGVKHFIWSTLPDVESVTQGEFSLPQFTNKARIDSLVKAADFTYYTFVVPPAYYQNFTGPFGPQKQQDGSYGWILPINPDVRCIHMGDINDLGKIVAGAFANPNIAGQGAYLPLVGDFLSFGEIVETLNHTGQHVTFKQVPRDVYAGFFPGAQALGDTLAYYEKYTYLGPGSHQAAIALANKIAGVHPASFESWARANFALDMK
ncbi:NmrA/HSCARG family protein [Cronobacter dublinensis]|uniref:NmrA/HSCARG family protein n=1 Tax=Cronobacter dublinensis TaxID=413497 RepID=UPI001D305758|nr:NmrA/HSCARG family protein [Cronobacter dublinensis subsp. dublinensis]EIV2971259.1 NmrA/HSCARG family protein [Cronobacter sakazakii]ELY2794785.1 NmrA/HSCARG family protein [Cronobacter dublinensis]EGT5667702.1 NmrA/HSCARG family protein [Cronobacter dublinensis subsp. dublinensis]EGT5672287.1 NmrA/HSCARG family protein [Cronobacter dublinensis subsp. dublinensis]